MSQSMVRGGDDGLAIALGERIRHTRGIRGITLREMAIRLGVSPATMSAVENGRTGISVLRLTEVARVLEVSTDELLSPTAEGNSGLQTADPSDNDWRHYEPLRLDAPLMAALEAFLEFGYHGSTMRDIARRAGLSVPGIYHHYPSKQEMLHKILDTTVTDLNRRCDLVIAETSADNCVERFSLLTENLVLFHTHRRDPAFIAATEMRSLEQPGKSRITAMRRRIQQLIDIVVECGHEQGIFTVDAPNEAARAVVMMCTGLAQWFSPTGPATPEQIAQWYVGYALGLVRHQG